MASFWSNATTPMPEIGAFDRTIENSVPAPKNAPAGMAWIPGGTFSMGASRPGHHDTVGMQATLDALPIHRVQVDAFWMDKNDVTNEDFERFVKATHYITVAERVPRAEDLPNVPVENLVAGGLVFSPPKHAVPLNNSLQWWAYRAGANWRHPDGPASNIVGREKCPVVQVAYDDALAYAKWAGKRLPTEAEWEFAARGGLSGKAYVWGDEFRPKGKWMANTFQGKFPQHNSSADGHSAVSAVGLYPANGYGLYDMAGNVWQWTSDWYRADYYRQLATSGGITRNPQGPQASLDPDEPNEKKRTLRGGSFLCTDQYCSRYRVGTRGKGEVSSATNHLGFRCVKDP